MLREFGFDVVQREGDLAIAVERFNLEYEAVGVKNGNRQMVSGSQKY